MEVIHLEKLVIQGGTRLHGEVTISGAKNAAVALVAGVGAVDGAVVEEPPRQYHVLELGARHTGDGGGHIRPHDANLAAAVDDLGEVFLGNIVACQGEHIIVFHLRRHDFRITPLAEHTGELALDDAPLHALAEQAISGALRGVGDVFHCVCTPI